MTPSKRTTVALMPAVSCVFCALCVLCLLCGAGCGPIRSTTTPLEVAAQAPPFTLPNQAGQQVALDELTDRGPAVLVFNRGHR